MNCETCGANLSLEDMTKPNCPYCHNVLKHHARAAEHAALVNKMLDQRIGAQYPGMPTPQIGYQFGAPLNPQFQQWQQQYPEQQIQASIKRASVITLIAVIVPIVLMIVIGGVVALMMFVR
jgi:hypothetical protein